jgi:integrase
VLTLHTGMRRGELAHKRQPRGRDLSAQSSERQRQIVLAPATIAALRQHRTVQLRERLALGEAWADSGYVFVDEAGQPYHPRSYLTMFRHACARARVLPIRLHELRHTMATLALQAGVHPKVVQEQLGHSAINVTMDVYSHVPQAVRRESASTIAALFDRPD